MAEPSDTISEEREELMVPSTGDGNPTLRTAHFLKPTITEPVLELPSLPLSYQPITSGLTKSPPKVQFKSRRYPQKNWKSWVDHLHGTFQFSWKKAGIYEAIMSSKYQISRHDDLVIGIAEKWCSETNTFIFTWGEATVTLEDMMVLGGYSVLGDSVLSPLESREMVSMKEKLIEACRQIRRTNGQASHYAWMGHFMGNGLELEHEAFLALWLSRYVFPANLNDVIGKNLFPIAIRLASGTPIALAPAVLASLYKDLGFLKEKIVISNKLGTGESIDTGLSLKLWAPFHLVQLWVWERFPTLRPKTNFIKYGEPRSARWHKLKKLKVENVRLAIDSAGECFQWRPYAAAVCNWSFHKFYREKEEWVLVNSDLDKEFESFARCLRVCELVGLDCVEQYLPHRVAMQFGLDQDIPGCVRRSNETPEVAWNNYNRPIGDVRVYIPPRLFESDVTTRYLRWWKQSLAPQDAIKSIVRQRRSSTRLPRNSKQNNEAKGSVDKDKLTLLELVRSTDKYNNVGNRLVSDVRPSLDTQSQTLTSCAASIVMVREENLQEKIMQSEALVGGPEKAVEDPNGKHNNVGNRLVSDVKPSLDTQSRTLSSCAASIVMVKEENLPMKPIEKIMQSEALVRGPERAVEDPNKNKAKSPLNDTVSINDYNGDSSSYGSIEVPGQELEARVRKLEKVIDGLKAKYDYKVEKKPRKEGQSDS